MPCQYEYNMGDMVVRYVQQDPESPPGLLLFPALCRDAVLSHRETLADEFEVVRTEDLVETARRPDALVQIKCAQHSLPGGFVAGHTLRNAESTLGLRLESQRCDRTGGLRVDTVLGHPDGYRCVHHLEWREGERHLDTWTEVENTGQDPLVLEMLSSFSLTGLTPFHPDLATGRLFVHRFRSFWAREGRHTRQSVEELHLEPAFLGLGAASLRLGQVGSMPVRGDVPLLAVEDAEQGVLWGVHLEAPASWQMELYRRDDALNLSGGLADVEFGHWQKTLNPGETFCSPKAALSCVRGGVDDLCDRLTQRMKRGRMNAPEADRSLPVIFNEWCTTWGNPSHDHLLALGRKVKALGGDILVIDDGWAEKPEGTFQFNGDWQVNRSAFPQGLKATADAIRDLGLIPGIWFEYEVCTQGTKAFDMDALHLQRNGRTLQVGSRHFWDFRNPEAIAYLRERVVDVLKCCGFGYLKIDYNDTIGLGCDHPDGLGEGLRSHLQAVQQFLRQLREEIPELIIENCSSGGHRLEPSFMLLTAMSSFSDAHESRSIPILAANLHRFVLPEQNQVWAVFRPQDREQHITYLMASCCLGRLCLSGDVDAMDEEQLSWIQKGIQIYKEAVPVIRDGKSQRFGPDVRSYRRPEGWQALLRTGRHSNLCLLVVHSFAGSEGQRLEIPLTTSGRSVRQIYASADWKPRIVDTVLHLEIPGEWQAAVILLEHFYNTTPTLLNLKP